jgi:hypothetical protein
VTQGRLEHEAWVTLIAEPGATPQTLSPLARRVVDHVRTKLDEEGCDFRLNLDVTGGVGYAEVHFRSLTRKEPDRGDRDAGAPASQR